MAASAEPCATRRRRLKKAVLIRSADPTAPRSSEISSHSAYLRRRQLLGAGVAVAALGAVPASMRASGRRATLDQPSAPTAGKSVASGQPAPGAPLAYGALGADAEEAGLRALDEPTPYQHVTGYNNFYEFGTGKGDPARHAEALLPVAPWTLRIVGEVARPGDYLLEDLLARHPLEERIYRMRCVEAWSMVIPWVGVPLAALLRAVEPTSRARYVAFTTLHEPGRIPTFRNLVGSLSWPYVEGLRLDEAMHPLTLLAVGVYGRALLPQNGAPLRLVVPWKYGFKGIKSIVSIRLVETLPPTSWNLSAPREYGFYANVNPAVPHPRWSQARERRLPGSLRHPNYIPTQLFNGYAPQVAELYSGMDLRRHF